MLNPIGPAFHCSASPLSLILSTKKQKEKKEIDFSGGG
jgi:hypothetical protein